MTVSDNHTATTTRNNEAAFSVTRSIPQLSMRKTPDTEGDSGPINGLLPPFSSGNVHLPTPHSPGNPSLYGPSISRNLTPSQMLSGDVLSTDYGSTSYPVASSSTFRPPKMITPDSSPLTMRSRSSGLHWKDDKRSQSPPRGMSAARGDRESSPHPRTSVDDVCKTFTHQSVEVRNAAINKKRPASPASSINSLPPHNSIRSPSLSSREFNEAVGGEMARIRAQLLENRMSLTQEAEARRPDYLKRARRQDSPPTLDPLDIDGQRVASAIGVTESPMKGRRLMLFQKTSDESFEESLMAGGYDRYRTDYEQATFPGDSNQSGESEAHPLISEQELRKQNRLASFRNSSQVSYSRSQLTPVEIEGCGRVLMSIGTSDSQGPEKVGPSKKKGSRKKKKTPSKDELKDHRIFPPQTEATDDGPNWPDAQFPWRLRSEQRDDYSKLEEEQRLQYIENFLSRDSDDEDPEENQLQNNAMRPGRGKMVPLLAQSQNRGRGPTTISVVQSDPADARTALLSKRSIRQFSIRRSSRKSPDGESDDEIVCICQGRDDGRELVQCDGCRTWYHLQCIGIRNVEDLGREEDPWFCSNCVGTPPPDTLPLSEPTLVPTEEKLKRAKGYDPPFFHAGLNPSPAAAWSSSPCPPMTPPGRTAAGPSFSSGSSRDETSSQRGPQTPQFPSRSVRVYTTGTPSGAERFTGMLDESPFDPTSTPSRGIRFGAPFTTPKNKFWQGRGPELFNTPPARPNEGMSSRHVGRHYAPGCSEEDLHLPVFSSSPLSHDMTPVGQNGVPASVGRLAESPLAGKGSVRRGPGCL